MNQKIEHIEDKSQKAVEKALGEMIGQQGGQRSFAPPDQRGIHELVNETMEKFVEGLRLLETIERRLAEFDRLQANFYNGRKP